MYILSNTRISRDVVQSSGQLVQTFRRVVEYCPMSRVLGSSLVGDGTMMCSARCCQSCRIGSKRIKSPPQGNVISLDTVKFGRQQNRKLIGIFFSFVPKFVVRKQRIQDDPVSCRRRRQPAVLDFVVVVLFDGGRRSL